MGIHLGLSLCGSPQELRESSAFFSFLRAPPPPLPPSRSRRAHPPCVHTYLGVVLLPPALFLQPFPTAPSQSRARPLLLLSRFSSGERLNARVSTGIPRVTGRCPSAATVAPASQPPLQQHQQRSAAQQPPPPKQNVIISRD